MKKQSLWKPLRIAAAAFFLLGCGAAFAGIGGGIAEMLHVQFGPALMRCLAAFSAGALATALGIAAFTFLFGRFYWRGAFARSASCRMRSASSPGGRERRSRISAEPATSSPEPRSDAGVRLDGAVSAARSLFQFRADRRFVHPPEA